MAANNDEWIGSPEFEVETDLTPVEGDASNFKEFMSINEGNALKGLSHVSVRWRSGNVKTTPNFPATLGANRIQPMFPSKNQP